MFLLIQVVISLNFLIAIISQSYESIMNRQQEAIMVSMNELNLQFANETEEDAEIDIQVIVLQPT